MKLGYVARSVVSAHLPVLRKQIGRFKPRARPSLELHL